MDFWWLMVNVFLAAAAPFLLNLLLWALNGGDSMMFAAYTDGELGFVAVGWCAAALYDMVTHPTIFPHPGNWQVYFGVVMALAGLFAAKGGRDPVRTPLPALTPAQKTTMGFSKRLWRRIKWFKTASWSIVFGVLSLAGMLYVHVSLPE